MILLISVQTNKERVDGWVRMTAKPAWCGIAGTLYVILLLLMLKNTEAFYHPTDPLSSAVVCACLYF